MKRKETSLYIIEESEKELVSSASSTDNFDRYRYENILTLQRGLEKELVKYEMVYKEYKKGDKFVHQLV